MLEIFMMIVGVFFAILAIFFMSLLPWSYSETLKTKKIYKMVKKNQ